LVYKKYMYRGGKKFGPYYFKSVRNKEGSVSSIYLGKKNPENNKFKILGVIILIFCAVSLLGYLSYNAFIVSDMPILEDSSEFSGSDNVISESSEEESILDSQPLDNDAAIPTEEGDTNRLPIPEEGGETDEINDISIDNPQEEISKNISDEINETDIDVPLDNTTGTNLSYINSTDIIEIPINVSVNETDEISTNFSEEIDSIELNISKDNLTEINFSEFNLTNITELNLTNITEINISINESLNVTINNTNFTIIESYENVIVNKPVKWEKIISYGSEVENINISLPDNADNVSVFEIIDEKQTELIRKENNINEITGRVIFSLNEDSFFGKLLEFLKNLFKFTGAAVSEVNVEFVDEGLVINGPIQEVKVEYYLPGPTSEEVEINNGLKQIIIHSDINYTNITVYSYFDEIKSSSLGIYNSDGDVVNFTSFDLNKNDLIDYVEWISLDMNETYNASLTVLNFQSFPVVGENWTVMFNTTGTANLKVYPVNGTTWGDDPQANDLRFLEISCGNKSMNSYWSNGTIIVENYTCSETGYESSYVRTAGAHYLAFEFGETLAYAQNSAVCGETITASNTLTGDLIDCVNHGITIGAHNIVLDCAGFTIDGRKTNARHGINIGAYDGITIKNCLIKEFDNGLLTWAASTDNLLTNNTFYNNTDYGVLFNSGSNNLRMINNTISDSPAGLGVWFNSSTNITFSENEIFNNNKSGLQLTGGAAAGVQYSNFFNNHIYNNLLDGTYTGNIILNSYVSRNNITNNTIVGGTKFGFRIYSNVSDNIFANNTIANSTDHLILFGDGVPSCDNNIFIGNTFSKPSGYVFVVSLANGTTFIDNTFNSNILFSSNGRDTTFINNSWTTLTTDPDHNFTVKQYLDVKVNTSSGNLQNANVSTFNSTDFLEFSELTDSLGQIARKNLTRYFFNRTTYIYFNNYTINTTSPSASYGNDSRQVNLSSNVLVNITLSSLNAAPNTPSPILMSIDNLNNTNSILNCSATITDPNSNNLNVTVRWYKDGLLNLTDYYNNSYTSGILFNATLGEQNTTKGEVWNCSVKLSDGILDSGWGNSSGLTILNTAPVLQSSRISPISPYTLDDLLGYCNATDIDNDNITYYYKWYNGTTLFRSDSSRVECGSGHTDNGDGTCTATLRPDAAGDLTEFTNQIPATGSHYDKVDEVSADDDTTYVGGGGDTIAPSVYVLIKENGVTSAESHAATASYVTNSYSRLTRPSDNNAWVINDIDDLQIGVREVGTATQNDLYNLPASSIPVGSTINNVTVYARYMKVGKTTIVTRVTQAYVEIKYTRPLQNYTQGIEINVDNLSNSFTTKNENWSFECTGYDNVVNSTAVNSSVIILNSAPTQVTLSAPTNGINTYNRTINFVWNVASDNDSDVLTYNLLVDDDANFGAPEVNQSGVSSTNYELLSDLAVDKIYYWKVGASDATVYGDYSEVWNITIDSLLDIRLLESNINFGEIGIGNSDNTSDDSPSPFLLENNGNTLMNVSVNSTQLFIQALLPSSNYMFKIDNNSGETNSFNWLTSLFDWTNMPSAEIVAIDSLKYQNETDSAEVDIFVLVPNDEVSGSKNANVTFKASLAE